MVHLSAKNLAKLAVVVVAAMQAVHASVPLDCNNELQRYVMRYTDMMPEGGAIAEFTELTASDHPQDVVAVFTSGPLTKSTKPAWTKLAQGIDLSKSGACQSFFGLPETWNNMHDANRKGWLKFLKDSKQEAGLFKVLAPRLPELPKMVREAILTFGTGNRQIWSSDAAGNIGSIELEELPPKFFDKMTDWIPHLNVNKHLNADAITSIFGEVSTTNSTPILAYMASEQLQKVMKNPSVCKALTATHITSIVKASKHTTVANAIETAACLNEISFVKFTQEGVKFMQGIPADAFKLLSLHISGFDDGFYKFFSHTQMQAFDADFPNVEFRCAKKVKLDKIAKPASIAQVNKECVTGFINNGGKLPTAVLNEVPTDGFTAVDVNDKTIITNVISEFNEKSNAGLWGSFFTATTNLWATIFGNIKLTVPIPKEAFVKRKIGGPQYAQIIGASNGPAFLQKMWSANSTFYFDQTVFKGIPMSGKDLMLHLQTLFAAKKFPGDPFIQHVGEDEPVGAANPCRAITMTQYLNTAKGGSDEVWAPLVEAAHPNCYRSLSGYDPNEEVVESKAKTMRTGQLVHLGLKLMIDLKQAEARFGSLTPRLFAVLTTDAPQCSLLTQALLKKLPAKTLAGISADCIANLPEKLTPDQVKLLPLALFGQFSEKHLTRVAVADMSKEQFAAFAGVKGIAKHFTADLIGGLTADQTGALSAVFIQDLPAEAFKGFTVAVFKAVKDEAWTLVTFEQFKNIPEDAVIEISYGAAMQLSSGVAADKKATRLFKENKALLEKVKNQQAREFLSGASMVVASVAAVAVSVIIALWMA